MDIVENTSPDSVIVQGLGSLDGEYGCDITSLLTEGHPECLTNREGHRVKVMSGVRAGELEDALEAGDNDVLIALAAIVLTRAGRRYDEAVLWDAPMGSAVQWRIADRGDASPPALRNDTPAGDSETRSGDGSERSSDPSQNGPSPTGQPDSETLPTSVLTVSGI